MNLQNERVLILGDSLSQPNGRTGPDVFDVTATNVSATSSAPGGVLAYLIKTHSNPQAVRINARVGRSARSFWSVESGGALVARDQIEFRPTKVIVFLGTNDIDLGVTPDAIAKTKTAFAAIRNAYQAMGAQVVAIGPPSYASAKYAQAAPAMLAAIRDVFGANAVVDATSYTLGAARSSDGVHFTSAGASAVAPRLLGAVQGLGTVTSPTSPSSGTTSTIDGKKLAIGVGVVAGLVGLGWLILHTARRAANRRALGSDDDDFIDAYHARPDVRFRHLIRDPDPESMQVAEDLLLENGLKLSDVSLVQGLPSDADDDHGYFVISPENPADAPYTRVGWFVSHKRSATETFANPGLEIYFNDLRIDIPIDKWNGSLPGGYRTRSFRRRSVVADAWAVAKALKQLSPDTSRTRLREIVLKTLDQDNATIPELYGPRRRRRR